MASSPRHESATGIHHVMNRGVDHQPIFFGDADRIEFGRRLAAIHREHEVTSLAYCLMGNHFHLLLQAPTGALSDAMQHMLSVYTRHTNDRTGRDGPMFRGRFLSIPVETDTYLLWVTRYIHCNPLAIPGVSSPADYVWSSYPVYLGRVPAPSFLDVAPVMGLFHGRRAELAAFTDGRGFAPSAHGEATDGRLPSVEDLRLLVDCAIAVDDLTHPLESRARQRLGRTVTTLVADRSCDAGMQRSLDIALGPRSGPAAAAAVRRARQRLSADPMVRRVVAWVETELAA